MEGDANASLSVTPSAGPLCSSENKEAHQSSFPVASVSRNSAYDFIGLAPAAQTT
ncbi:hypothetical protein CfE428DRAFT_5621 [Chthoniobacter flavus Ellin428]|uniref:Uncharacterized protein n=1 Tax=Chthoniobacter flavus Ellin428 TaxID=497964 RepID=B4D9N1_9BACT|nr:hypothetical protein CfE428DRAFT_5621 [Chthoniobacter flavus Ellin428]